MRLFRVVKTMFVLVLLMLAMTGRVLAEEKVVVNLFYLNTCPHCHEEIEFLEDYEKEGGIVVKKFEVSNSKNRQLWSRVGRVVGAEIGPVPLTVIGDQFIPGFDEPETTGEEIRELVGRVREEGLVDVTSEYIEDEGKSFVEKVDEFKSSASEKRDLPSEVKVFGKKIELKNLSLPMLTIVLGVVDGFNPCAMWILLFLISLLLNMDNRLKMWVLGLTFIGVSGVMYFIMMAAWLNLFLLVGLIVWIRYIVGLFSIGAGGWQVKLWWQGRAGGCEASDDEKRQKLFSRLKKVVYEEKLWLSLLGIAALAVGVNLFELMCSAGLPAVFTSVLTLNNLPSWQYYLYILGYVLLFMLDDIVIFVIAMLTLKATGLQSKYASWARLIGGVIMLWIGYAMLFRPESLAF
jgi:thiol-disulfide isomerase/thioredoxin